MATGKSTRVRDRSIHLKNTRLGLPPRREPYWRHLAPGRFIGYRKMESGSETWIARFTDEDQQFHTKRLGTLAELPTWGDAVAKANDWFAQCAGGLIRAGTVEQVLRDYVTDRRQTVSAKNAADAEKRFKAMVYGTALARTPLDKLSAKIIDDWRTKTLAGSTPESTLRAFKAVRAALQRAFRLGEIQTDAAWKRVPLKAGELSENQLDLYWPIDQRRTFLDECPQDLRDLLTAICHTGARPQEIASAVVRDFDQHARTLTLRHRKGHRSALKARAFALSNDAAFEFFKLAAKDKADDAPLLTRTSGAGWYSELGHGAWVAMLKRVRRKHKFDDRVSAYHFRHWIITDMLNAGIAAANIATLCGTSIAMIDAFYKKSDSTHIADQLKAMVTV